MGACDDGAAVAQMGDSARHSAFAFLCRGHRPARFQRARGGDELDFAGRVLCRTKSFCLEQFGCGRVLSFELEHERILRDWVSTFVRGGGRNYFTGRSARGLVATPWCARSILAGPISKSFTPDGWNRLPMDLPWWV